jgi:hypothetical protein
MTEQTQAHWRKKIKNGVIFLFAVLLVAVCISLFMLLVVPNTPFQLSLITNTSTPADTFTPAPTSTRIDPPTMTWTPTSPTPTLSYTPTWTDTPTMTYTPTPTDTFTPAPTYTSTYTSTPSIIVIATTACNLRSGPGSLYPQIGTAQPGDSYPVEAQALIENRYTWYLMVCPNQERLWIYSGLVRLEPTDAVIPTAETIPPLPPRPASPTFTPIPPVTSPLPYSTPMPTSPVSPSQQTPAGDNSGGGCPPQTCITPYPPSVDTPVPVPTTVPPPPPTDTPIPTTVPPPPTYTNTPAPPLVPNCTPDSRCNCNGICDGNENHGQCRSDC